MARKTNKALVREDGSLIFFDPGFETLPLLKAVNPEFHIQTSPLPGFTSPRFLRLRKQGTGLAPNEMKNLSEKNLQVLHFEAMQIFRNNTELHCRENEVSLLDLKIELARRLLEHCVLCGRRCGVNRLKGEKGICGLDAHAYVYEHYVHIAEEPEINPSLLVHLAGCGLRCSFCHRSDLFHPHPNEATMLSSSLWSKLHHDKARSLSFIGGNPDESLYSILCFMKSAPGDWNLPVVWNCNGYGSLETAQLLEGLIDAYIPDIKFGNNECSYIFSKTMNYTSYSLMFFDEIIMHNVPIMIRIPFIYGHYTCCVEPIVRAVEQILLNNKYTSYNITKIF